ncbi:MAG TPA: hypothetical protein PK648_15835 [Verrucomicrobiales bacterium]|jgi:hypothetical protein|nr:hypothetical protein [Verrucomicrobiales bacterium]
MNEAEQKILQKIRMLFADVRAQKGASYTPQDVQRMKIQWRASSEANRKITRDTNLQRAKTK